MNRLFSLISRLVSLTPVETQEHLHNSEGRNEAGKDEPDLELSRSSAYPSKARTETAIRALMKIELCKLGLRLVIVVLVACELIPVDQLAVLLSNILQ